MTMRENGNAASTGLPNGENGGTYEFKLKGHLDDRWLEWFEGMTLRYTTDEKTGLEITEIHAAIPDQPALHGFLNKIRDLNLTLLSVKRLRPAKRGGAGNGRVQSRRASGSSRP